MRVSPILRTKDDRDVFIIPKQTPNGFEVELEYMDYGVYPSAEGWHGGCWDVTVFEPSEIANSLREFIGSILCDASLEVKYSNDKPYCWILHYQYEGERVKDETGLLFFNWLGWRKNIEFTNAKITT
jgi:hypothetical protein